MWVPLLTHPTTAIIHSTANIGAPSDRVRSMKIRELAFSYEKRERIFMNMSNPNANDSEWHVKRTA